jgi:pyridoxal phosphate enzyme (YggS family)
VSTLDARIAAVRARIDEACARAARPAGAVTLVAASKTVGADTVRTARDGGIADFGENRAQELVAKASVVARCTWHMIGRLQTNKVRSLAPHVALWHTVDRPGLVDALVRHGVTAPVLLQVNVGAEPNKGGCPPDALDALLEHASRTGLDVRGLMAVPPASTDPRPHFDWLRDAATRLGLTELSMGMSSDFETAIACGATIVRVGSALFGARPPIAASG